MSSNGPLILFGSETGTAEDVSEKLLRQSCHFSELPHCRLYACDSYSIEEFPKEQCVVLVCSTTGQGDPPENMQRFWRFIMRRGLPGNSLQQMNFAVLGLGDSSYQKYNFVGKKMYRRFVQLGANPLLPIGLCDDQHPLGVDSTLLTWLPKFWSSVLDVYKISIGPNEQPLTLARLDDWTTSSGPLPFKFKVEISIDPSQVNGLNDRTASISLRDVVYPKPAVLASVKSNTRVTAANHFQDTRHIIFATSNVNLPYKPGDVLHVQPRNSDEDVAMLLNLIGLDESTIVTVTETDQNFPPPSLPPNCTVRWLARHYFDINAVPRRSFFEVTGIRSTHELERERLLELASAEGLDDLLAYCSRPRRTVLEVMQDFPNTTAALPLGHWFDVLGPIKARAFSIASSPTHHIGEIHLLVAVVEYKTKLVKPRRGLASNFLASLDPAASPRVPVWVRPGTVTFPASSGTPAIMVGPGTGVAPFRSFIMERCATLTVTNQKDDSPPSVLFFGCRYRSKDFYFQSEFEQLVDSEQLSLFTAFSRDDFVYVQQRIRDQGALLWRLLSLSGANFYVAGSARSMPDGVRDAVKSVAQQHGGLSENEAEEWLTRLEQRKQYQTETWS